MGFRVLVTLGFGPGVQGFGLPSSHSHTGLRLKIPGDFENTSPPGLGFRVSGLGFRVEGSAGITMQDLGAEFRTQGVRRRVSGGVRMA